MYNTSVHLESSNHPTRTHALAYLCQSQHTTPSRPVPEGIQARRASRAAGGSIKPAQMHTRPPRRRRCPLPTAICYHRRAPAARRHRRLSFSPADGYAFAHVALSAGRSRLGSTKRTPCPCARGAPGNGKRSASGARADVDASSLLPAPTRGLQPAGSLVRDSVVSSAPLPER